MTDLLARRRCSSNVARAVNASVVSTAVWVIDWVHCDTADAGVEFASRLRAVVSCTGLHQRLLSTAVSCKNTNGCAAFGRRSLRLPLGSRTRTLSPIRVSSMALLPPERANLPPSPGRHSTLQMAVPSGIGLNVVTLPVCRLTFSPNATSSSDEHAFWLQRHGR